ncbi:MAG: M18 family aminopeptidase [Bacilli bacterium]|nr:M18 family aminopeptidase [Bacilli bacterium]
MNDITETLALLNASYSPFHVVKNIEDKLLEAGYTQLKEQEMYEIKEGGRYFVKRNGTSIIAFQIPAALKSLYFKITATHNDSPTFKIKPNPVVRYKNLASLNVEPYGGAIYSTWMDRPLSLAGRVMVMGKDGVEARLLAIDEDLLSIPNLCIHMNREINKGYAYNPAKDMLPLLGEVGDDFDFSSYIAAKLGLKKEESILSFDLFLYNRDKACLMGMNKEFLGGGRLDDLSATYSVLLGFLAAEDKDGINVFASFDNEEVGSLTKQGANSDFLRLTLKRILKSLGKEEMFEAAIAGSALLSIDNAHANHPNHPEISDKTTDVRLNGGIVIKYNAAQSYTSDAMSAALVKKVAAICSVTTQDYTNRSDLRGGSTLGNISNSEVSLTSCDIGIAQLAMHSSYELLGAKDIEAMEKLVKTYFSASLKIEDGGFTIA